IAKGVTEPILSPGNVIRKRRLVQSRRLVPDSMLIGHVIKSPSLTRFIETVSKRPPRRTLLQNQPQCQYDTKVRESRPQRARLPHEGIPHMVPNNIAPTRRMLAQ